MIKYEHAISAAREYCEGLKIKAQIEQLSSRKLAEKFGRRPSAIRDVFKGRFVGSIPESERRQIVECLAERERLKGIYRGKTMEALKSKYKVCRQTIVDYAECVDG